MCIRDRTHGDGTEGASGEKVITTRSTDKGATWTAAIEVEPQAPSEYAYSTLLGAGAADSRCLLYTSPSPRDGLLSRMPSSA